MMDFSRAPLTFLLPLPVLILMVVGFGTICVGIGYVLLLIAGHLAWV